MSHKKLFVILLVGLGFFLGSLAPVFSQATNINGFAQGTSYRVIYYGSHQVSKIQIDSVLAVLDSSLSTYKPFSLISQFNRPETQEIALDKHLYRVVKASFLHWRLSGGIFDISIGALSRLYKTNPSPDAAEVAIVLQKVGMKKLHLKGRTLQKKVPGIVLDVDGIAQGYSVDVLAAFLERQGVENFLVEIGGEIATRGTHENGQKFKIAIEAGADDEIFETLEIKDEAITSSGKVRATHLSALTGKPISGNTAATTVKTSTAIDADAFDNYIFALPKKKRDRLVKKYKLGVLIFDDYQKEVYRSRYF